MLGLILTLSNIIHLNGLKNKMYKKKIRYAFVIGFVIGLCCSELVVLTSVRLRSIIRCEGGVSATIVVIIVCCQLCIFL